MGGGAEVSYTPEQRKAFLRAARHFVNTCKRNKLSVYICCAGINLMDPDENRSHSFRDQDSVVEFVSKRGAGIDTGDW